MTKQREREIWKQIWLQKKNKIENQIIFPKTQNQKDYVVIEFFAIYSLFNRKHIHFSNLKSKRFLNGAIILFKFVLLFYYLLVKC